MYSCGTADADLSLAGEFGAILQLVSSSSAFSGELPRNRGVSARGSSAIAVATGGTQLASYPLHWHVPQPANSVEVLD
jgi:hypothetical protein